MKRLIDTHLRAWKTSLYRKALLLRGARQVGKTTAVRKLGEEFDHFVEVNLELTPKLGQLFEQDLDPTRILRDLHLETGQRVQPGKTLLFFDEIQAVPKAVMALRYFYELLPELHVIAAGSLLDFVLNQVGLPVGRVFSLYMYPMSFLEFLYALGHEQLVDALSEFSIEEPFSELIHEKLLRLVGEYLAIGGMPNVVKIWRDVGDSKLCNQTLHGLASTYRQDFRKYAKRHQIKYLELLFNNVPYQLSQPFNYGKIEGDYRKRELAPCLELLETAGVCHRVFRSAGNGVPIGAEADPNDFKVIGMDVALTQTILGWEMKDWFLDPLPTFVNKGALTEAFVGQELLVYSDPSIKQNLYYWRRQQRGAKAEVDYLWQKNERVIPVEVKSGEGRTLQSIRRFLTLKERSPYGIRLSAHNASIHDSIHSYPLYALSRAIEPKDRAIPLL